MPDPSYWPLVMCLGFFPFGYGVIYKSPVLLAIAAVVMLAGFFGWIIEPVAEATTTTTSPSPHRRTDAATEHATKGNRLVSAAAEETTLGLDHRKLAMWVFLGSEFLFFGAFITAYLIFLTTRTAARASSCSTSPSRPSARSCC
jgi:hypothetical protein